MSSVSFEEFAREFASDLNIENDDHLTKPLKEVKQYDSMGKITASLTIEGLFGIQVSYTDLDSQETLEALYHYCLNQLRDE